MHGVISSGAVISKVGPTFPFQTRSIRKTAILLVYRAPPLGDTSSTRRAAIVPRKTTSAFMLAIQAVMAGEQLHGKDKPDERHSTTESRTSTCMPRSYRLCALITPFFFPTSSSASRQISRVRSSCRNFKVADDALAKPLDKLVGSPHPFLR